MVAETLAWAVGELAEMSSRHFDVDHMLRRMCEVAAQSLSVDGVGVMGTNAANDTRFVHATDPQLAALEALQETLQEGPCRDAIDTGGFVGAATIAEMRWPAFEQVAADNGIQAVLAFPLTSRGRTWGTLDLYWRSAHLATDHDRACAELLAKVAVSYLVMAADRAQSRDAHELLVRRVLHDQLTGLPNRGLMEELIERALASAERRGTLVAVLFIDLDRFKPINDTFGHQAGDLVLQVVAQRLQSIVRAGDTVGRISGDEFLVLCEDIADRDLAAEGLGKLGHRIRDAVARPIRVNRNDVTVGASVGIAVTADQPSTAELIHSADVAMYKAKGSNGVVVTWHAPGKAAEQRSLERRLMHAVDRDELAVHYQPIVTHEGTVVAVEALIRWQHPELGLLRADEFVHLAEASGVIVRIGQWLITQAVRQLQRWRQTEPATAPTIMFCNFSPGQLSRVDLPDTLASTLSDHGLTTSDFGIGIVEAHLADPAVITALTALQQNGHPLAVDDFGTGYSSLSRLVDLPVRYVKIDRTLVAKLPDERRARTMIKAVLGFAADLDLIVISEGVETRAQADYLRQAGVNLLQGNHFGRPMPATDLTLMLASS